MEQETTEFNPVSYKEAEDAWEQRIGERQNG
jgi:hypothetical protein